MNRTLLLVGGGIETVPAIRRARDLGLTVVVSDGNPQAPCFPLADHSLVASTYDVQATLAAAVRFHREVRPLDGVTCVATDVPLSVATVAQELGLPGISVEAARRATDKLAMKDRFRADGIPIPWYAPVESARELERIVAAEGYPLVLKPVDSRGSRGVLLLRGDLSPEEAYARTLPYSPTGRVMVERYLPGPQVSTESAVLDGRAYTPGFSDRNYELLERYAPHFIENGGDMPSRLPSSVQGAARDLVERAAASLGVSTGIVKGDLVVTEGEPRVIEMAARLSGGFFCTHQIPANTGVDLVTAAMLLALGERPDPSSLVPRFIRGVSQRRFFPPPGRLVRVEGEEEARRLPGVVELLVYARPGDEIRLPEASNGSSGTVITEGETHDEARARMEAVFRTIRFFVEPL